MDPRRELVLADIRAGMSTRDAGAKHGVPKSTAAKWALGARDGRPAGHDSKVKRVDREGKADAEPSSSSRTPARASAIEDAVGMGNTLRQTTKGLLAFVALESAQAARHAADPTMHKRAPDMRQVNQAASALATIVERLGDILAVPDRTHGTQDTSSADAVSDKLRAAIARKHANPVAGAGGLKLVDGGKVTSHG